MIKIQYVADIKKMNELFFCDGCGKSNWKDEKMICAEFIDDTDTHSYFLLCDKCRKELREKI